MCKSSLRRMIELETKLRLSMKKKQSKKHSKTITMCTFCGRIHNNAPSTKTISVYDKNNKYLGSFEVPYSWGVKRYQEGLWRKYPDWKYTK